MKSESRWWGVHEGGGARFVSSRRGVFVQLLYSSMAAEDQWLCWLFLVDGGVWGGVDGGRSRKKRRRRNTGPATAPLLSTATKKTN